MTLLTAPAEDPRREAACLWDLWRNAERRAAQGRYDDAVARIYRLLEWTAQWLLRSRGGIETSNLRPESIPDGVRTTKNHRGEYQAGLLAAWDLVAHHLDTEAVRWVQAERGCLQHHIKMRNDSILAHGDSPVTQDDWERFAEWVTRSFIPTLAVEVARAGLRFTPSQLPQQPIW
ncbi:MAG: TIGR02710 family CRISPR-associated CARF protein [Candidatus Methylomirabilis sp.]|nr:TIGR02710 family CRISPR-associated CARF protein [Candidatus Methylomirabilis sp.]